MEMAKIAIEEYLKLFPEDEPNWTARLLEADTILNNTENYKKLGDYTGSFRSEENHQILHIFIQNDQLIMQFNNRTPLFLYPCSDSVFKAYNADNAETFRRVSNNRISLIEHEYNYQYEPEIYWKEDSYILEARELLEQVKTNEALAAFQNAYKENPEHYYLANYIQHLEFISNKESEDLNQIFDGYVGQYDHINLYREQDQFYYETEEGFIYRLLPLNESRFLIPSRLNSIFTIEMEDEIILGAKVLIRDGTEEIYSKTNEITPDQESM